MSDPTILIPNLNKIMEEYIELENQTEQVSRAVAEQIEGREDENEEYQQTMEESRKRKRGTDEAEAEQRKYRTRNLVSNKAEALMEICLKDRGFIAERGFKKLISPFAEMLENRGWQSLGEYKEPGYAALVKEFFANLVEREGKKVYVKGQWIDFNKEEINRLYSLGHKRMARSSRNN